MLLAGLPHGHGPVALGHHHHRAARGLELIDERIHSSRGGRAERAGGIALGCLRRTRVIDRMIFEIVRQRFVLLQPLAQFGVRGVASDNHSACQRQPRLDRMF